MVTETKRTYHVLYIESDAQKAKLFRTEFNHLVIVLIVPGTKEALDVLEENYQIDTVIVNDTSDGQAFFSALQGTPYFKDLQIILLSEEATAEAKNRPFGDHIIDVFPFDYSVEDLRTRLNYLIKKRDYELNVGHNYKGAPIWMPIGKRAFDIIVSSAVLLFLSPLLLIVAILIKLDSKGPVFYKSKRVGTGYRTFKMVKFRTMRTDADKMLSGMASKNMYNQEKVTATAEDGRCEVCRQKNNICQRPLYLDNRQICEQIYQQEKRGKAMFMKFREDPRVTRLGKFLRNTSIDELPQLFNILIGDMSIVGNRPLPPYEAEKLTATGYARRFAAPAGLTGLWQVTKRGTRKVSDQERIQLDILYAKTYSLRTDLFILIKTVKAVWQKENV